MRSLELRIRVRRWWIACTQAYLRGEYETMTYVRMSTNMTRVMEMIKNACVCGEECVDGIEKELDVILQDDACV